MNCPNCSAPMEGQALGGIYGPDIEVDLCFACHLMWLDRRESIQLSPGGTLALFEILHEHRDDPRHALGARMACPRCRRRLSLTRDIGRGGRFSYYSCPSRDGRLTPFSEFLKEKQFVRSLSPAEQSRVRAELKSVQCSGCGAPVDLVEGFKCQHCGSPITVLDADAVAKALRDLESAEARRSGDPAAAEARARALAALESLQADRDDPWRGGLRLRIGSGPGLSLDLLSRSIASLFGRF